MNFARTAAFVAAALSAPVAAQAADENFCDEYASQAVISATQNRSKQCGYRGGRWGLDYDAHYDWCLQVPEDEAMRERIGRKQEIQACFQNGGGGGGQNRGKVYFCKEYANQAVIAASQNDALQCGYTGGRWGFSYKVHFTWCMQVPKQNAMSERFARKSDLQECQDAN